MTADSTTKSHPVEQKETDGPGQDGIMTKTIELSHIVKKFGDHTVIDDVCLEVAEGEVTAIIGPSGAGTVFTDPREPRTRQFLKAVLER
jgi:ABC-type glutathione transport system ATPase component